jgi:penicillin-binding protein 1C
VKKNRDPLEQWASARIKPLASAAAAVAFSAGLVAFALLCWSRAVLEPMPASFMLLDRHGTFMAQIGGSDETGYGYWPPPAASERIVEAILALEDRRFWRHPGVDALAVLRAAGQDLVRGRRVSGASSIAMQVARLQHPAPRTLANKAIETGTALCLTLRYGREAVLRHYLRIVPFGNNSHGVAQAARFYFDKPAADLSWAEIALLASLPQAPTRLNPLAPAGKEQAIRRGERVLAYLHEAGIIADRDLALAHQQLAAVTVAARPRRPDEAVHAILRLERQLGGADAWLASHQEARIIATLDLDLQRQVERLAAKRLVEWRASGADQVSIAVIDRASRDVLVWIGSGGYFDGDAGAIDFADINRSPGSTLKPFLYGLALDRGIIRADMPLRDEPDVAPGIENADRRYLGRLLPRQALANSRNAPAAALVRQLGIDETYSYLRSLGLHESDRPSRHYGLGLAVGALPTSLERLVRAYDGLANDGMLGELRWYKGEDLPEPQRVLSAAAARQVTLFLSDPMARMPSFSRMGPAEFVFPVAVKTGTSQDYRDAWTIAYSPKFVVGAWVGRADAGPMQAMGGMGSAAELVHDVLLALHKDPTRRLDGLTFPPPAAHRLVDVCSGDRCTSVFREWVPTEGLESADHVLVDRRTGTLATQATADDDVIEERVPMPVDWRPLARARARDSVRVDILSPENGARLLHNPDQPAEAETVALRAAVTGPFRTLAWYIDGRLYSTVGSTEALRWPLQPGIHKFQALLPGRPESSGVVTIMVVGD